MDFERLNDLFKHFDNTLDNLLAECPVGTLPMANTLCDNICKKTLNNMEEDLVNTSKYMLIASIIFEWYNIEGYDFQKIVWDDKSRQILDCISIFVANLKEEFDDGKK